MNTHLAEANFTPYNSARKPPASYEQTTRFQNSVNNILIHRPLRGITMWLLLSFTPPYPSHQRTHWHNILLNTGPIVAQFCSGKKKCLNIWICDGENTPEATFYSKQKQVWWQEAAGSNYSRPNKHCSLNHPPKENYHAQQITFDEQTTCGGNFSRPTIRPATHPQATNKRLDL